MEGRVKGQRSRKSLICQNTMEGEQNPRHYWRVDLHHIHVLQLCCSGMGLLLSKSLMKKRTCNYNIMYFRHITPSPSPSLSTTPHKLAPLPSNFQEVGYVEITHFFLVSVSIPIAPLLVVNFIFLYLGNHIGRYSSTDAEYHSVILSLSYL